uniref:hypothetical protein n=1 Tax=Marinobacterium profundum TaxID=1714300 RepID=UPI00082F03CB|nr:hypothetical protein [Marinobacterium profundum]
MTITNIDLPAKLLRAAQEYQAVNDVRYYLNGIVINTAGYIGSTNGHCAFWAQCAEAKQLKNTIIMNIGGAIPAKAETAHISLHENGNAGYMWFSCELGRHVLKKGSKVYLGLNLVDGTFPDLERVMPKGELVATPAIGLNPNYIAKAGKAGRALGSKSPTVELRFRGADSCIEMLLKHADYNAKVIVMPCEI